MGLCWAGPFLLGEGCSQATSPTRAASWVLCHLLPWTVPRTGRWSRELEGAQGRAGTDGMDLERDVGVGCRLGPRGFDKALAWHAFSSSDG